VRRSAAGNNGAVRRCFAVSARYGNRPVWGAFDLLVSFSTVTDFLFSLRVARQWVRCGRGQPPEDDAPVARRAGIGATLRLL
jgi:hypothetical protein